MKLLALAVAALLSGGEPVTPKTAEVSFGLVEARAPAGATRAELFVGARMVQRRVVSGPRVSFRLARQPGAIDVRVRFERRGYLVRRDEARRVWLLPASARVAVRPRGRDARLAARLASLGRSYDGYAALWVHDLRTGRTAGWNSDTSFPAASMVKLGVMIAALDRFGPRPERASAWPLIRDLAVWSSNDATNKLLIRLGGSEAGGSRIAERTLHRLGARASTFTGFYRLGTSVADDRPRPLPVLTYRRTTARDVGRILLELHAAAVGNRLALKRTGLSRHEARVGLALLLSSDPRGDNVGLFRRALPRSVPMAQKHGWTTKLRHSGAIVYGPRGPRIVVALTFRPDEIRPAASGALGAAVIRSLGP